MFHSQHGKKGSLSGFHSCTAALLLLQWSTSAFILKKWKQGSKGYFVALSIWFSLLQQGSALHFLWNLDKKARNKTKVRQAGFSSDAYLPNCNPQIMCKNWCNKNGNRCMPLSPISVFAHKGILFHPVHTGSSRALTLLIVSSDQFLLSLTALSSLCKRFDGFIKWNTVCCCLVLVLVTTSVCGHREQSL